MKFRYKVLCVTLLLLSIGISIVGFVIMNQNMNLTLDTQIRNAIDENNMLQESIEYQLLDVAEPSHNKEIKSKINQIMPSISMGISASGSEIYVFYSDSRIYQTAQEMSETAYSLNRQAENGHKKYIMTQEGTNTYIYVCSCSMVGDQKLCIINRWDATPVYKMMDNQTNFFYVLLISALLIGGVAIYVLIGYLTKPLEDLSNTSRAFGNGDYTSRATVYSDDEFGNLASTYNEMAKSVSEHIDALENTLDSQERFVAAFTHEIKTPMTSIIGYADLIRSKDLSEEDLLLSASYIFSEGARLEAMSQKLFDILSAKQNKIELKTIWVEAMMDTIVRSVEPALTEKKIKLELDYEQAYLRADFQLLVSAFINLIDNARKASTTGKKIYIQGKRNQNTYDISIRDEGSGIPESHLSKITEAFYMVDKSRSRMEGGAGLGLSLANTIFESHDAKMEIQSRVGRGTTITVRFPWYENINSSLETEED